MNFSLPELQHLYVLRSTKKVLLFPYTYTHPLILVHLFQLVLSAGAVETKVKHITTLHMPCGGFVVGVPVERARLYEKTKLNALWSNTLGQACCATMRCRGGNELYNLPALPQMSALLQKLPCSSKMSNDMKAICDQGDRDRLAHLYRENC